RQDGGAYRAAVDSPGLRVDEAVGPGHVSRSAPQTYRYVSQRVRLPLQSPLLPTCLIRNNAWTRGTPWAGGLLGCHWPRQSPQGRRRAQARATASKNSDRNATRRLGWRPNREPKSGFERGAAARYG